MAAQKTRKAVRTKRRDRKNIESGIAHIRSTFNNTIVTITDPHGNAIHGLCLTRPWEVVEQSAARLVGRFHASKIEPEGDRYAPAQMAMVGREAPVKEEA